jgi:tetratricopeptide (TPR) repeat protein
MLALLDGHLADAEECAQRALSLGARAENATATQYYAIQLHILRHEQGRLAELEVPARQLVGASPAIHAWRAGFGRVLFEIGQIDEAQRELDALAEHGFTDIPRDANWLIAVTVMAELASGLGDAERASLLYELLLPYRDYNIVVALAALCLGSAARYLGQLALTIGRHDEAIEHFEQALVGNAALRSPLWLAHTQLDYAKAVRGSSSAVKLVDTAAETARELDLPQVARRAREIRGG